MLTYLSNFSLCQHLKPIWVLQAEKELFTEPTLSGKYVYSTTSGSRRCSISCDCCTRSVVAIGTQWFQAYVWDLAASPTAFCEASSAATVL